MNLIEQLGGYEKAKIIIISNEDGDNYNSNYYEYYSDNNVYEDSINIMDIEKSLLEYRRENSIFDFGDKVVYLPNIAPDHNDVYEVCYSKEGMKSCFISHLNFDCKAFYSDIRHATDEEIKVGNRI